MKMDRRTFLQIIAGSAAGAFLAGKGFTSVIPQQEEEILMSVVEGPDPALAAKKAVRMLGGMRKFVSPGDRVLIKPNISWDRKPEQAATTNPRIVTAVIEMVKAAGADKITVADNTCNEARYSYKRSGIKEAAEKAGAEVPYVMKKDFVEVDLKGKTLNKWPAYSEALEADRIINLPIAKHHGLSGVTLSMKNMMGLIGGRRNLLHQKLSSSIIDLTAFFKPQLTILDAYRILLANGPQGSTLEDVVMKNTVAASADPVRIDSFGISLFGDIAPFNQNSVSSYLKMAEDRGLGQTDYKSTGFRKISLE